jgi:CBS domain-containing protein
VLVSQILKAKGDLVFTISPFETLAAATERLADRKVGALVVMDSADRVVGILSERDIVRLVAEAGGQGLQRSVETGMTRDVVFAEPTETCDQLMSRMTDRRIRHLPVCQGGRLVGLVSIGDLVKVRIAEIEAESEGLKAYIAGG